MLCIANGLRMEESIISGKVCPVTFSSTRPRRENATLEYVERSFGKKTIDRFLARPTISRQT